jgi:alpha-mannosidase
MSPLDNIAKLSHLTRRDVQKNWLIATAAGKPIQPVTLNEKQYIIWPAGRQIQYLTQKIIVPEHLAGYPLEGMELRLILTWWAEDVKIYVNNQFIQAGDLFDSSTRILLSNSVSTGQEILVTLRLVSPNHDIGGLMKSQLIYEYSQAIDPSFVADELTILHNYLQTFYPENLAAFTATLDNIDWDNVTNKDKFNQSLESIRQSLQTLAQPLKERSFHLLGHAHLDLAWLWPLAETWQVAKNTFISVLNLQKDFTALIFGHSSPLIYEWIEKHHPELFQAILEAYKGQSWELLGGMWVEPEVNLISGESLFRQLLYGQKYFQEKFGQITETAWLPDTFGFPYQLPQILKSFGIKYFVTGKLHWNDTTKFPHGFFWWQSPDGSKILSLMSPPNVAGVMDTNPIIMTDHALNWERQTGLKDIFWLPGVGDHGGGPTRDMLAVAQRWQKSPFFPQLKFSQATTYLDSLETNNLPIWDDELYLEFHRGCYTTHADQKAYNRYCDILLYQGELWSSLANILLDIPYPKVEIESAWKKVLLNQFHDILPGTSIPEVFRDANQLWQQVISTGEAILEQALQAIATQINLPNPPHPQAKPFLIFNSLNWERTEVISLAIESVNCSVYDLNNCLCPSQLSHDNQLLFLAENIPSVGYKLFWLVPNQQATEKNLTNCQFILDNGLLKVTINSETGDIDSIFDIINQREILQAAGNQLQAFKDQGQYWDAWNIDPNYQQYPLPKTVLKSIKCLECGPLRWQIRIIRSLADSEFCQDYILEKDSPILQIKTIVSWQQEHTLVKTAFPLTLNSNFITYEIACGAIERDHQTESPKWEVYGHKWADLTEKEASYGVSLLNNNKYGYDATNQQLRLTLLRSPRWPDPEADLGKQEFTYAIYPHQGNWKTAKTVHYAWQLNSPVNIIFITNYYRSTQLPPVAQWLKFSVDNLILMSFKQSETSAQSWVMRVYECQGENAVIDWQNQLQLTIKESIDGLERAIDPIEQISPWQIATWLLKN